MASPEAALVAALIAEASVSALVGARVFVFGGRQGAAYPYVTLQRISTSGAAFLDGASNLDWPRIQIDSWAESPDSARAVADAIRAFLDQQEHTAGGLTFLASLQDDRSDVDGDTRKFRVSQDYLIFHER